jgi:rare lipoprotein A
MKDYFAEEVGNVATAPKDYFAEEIEKAPEKMVGGIFGKVPESAYNQGERNILGNIFERPGAAIRSALQGKGYVEGAVNPTNVPTFQELAIQASQQTTSPIANAALGMIPSTLGLAADMVTSPTDVLTSVIPGLKPVQMAGKVIASTKPAQAITKIATTPIEQLMRPTSEQLSQRVSKVVKDGVEKAIRPSVIGKKTATQQASYFKKAESVVNDVLDNKPNLEIVDKDGSLVVGRNPESLNEALQAVGQTKENMFETYSPMIKKASAEGATVDGGAIARKLRSFAAQEDVQIANPSLVKYATDMADNLDGRVISLDTAEATAKRFNAMLKEKYHQAKLTGADVSSAHVDDMVLRYLRNEIADKAGVGDFKRRYGALSEFEGDLAKRAIVAGRQNKVGLVDSIASIESGADIAGAVAMSAFTGNPMWLGLAVRGIGAKAAGSIIKGINSPDANISRMFKNVEKLRSTPVRLTPAEAVTRSTPFLKEGAVDANIKEPVAGALPDNSALREYSVPPAPQGQITGTPIRSVGYTPSDAVPTGNLNPEQRIGIGYSRSAEGQGRPQPQPYAGNEYGVTGKKINKKQLNITSSGAENPAINMPQSIDDLERYIQSRYEAGASQNELDMLETHFAKQEARVEKGLPLQKTPKVIESVKSQLKTATPEELNVAKSKADIAGSSGNNPQVEAGGQKDSSSTNRRGTSIPRASDRFSSTESSQPELKSKLPIIAGATATGIALSSEAHADTPKYKVGDKQTTEASTYGWGEKLNDKTYDGKKFDPMDVTAAMRNVPMGSKVKVTDKKTGKSVVVKINDGGPAHKTKRAIDLSQGAWRKLGYNRAGLTNVEIEILSLGDGKRYIGHSKKKTPIKKRG